MNICCTSDFCGSQGDFGSRIREIAEAGFTHYFWCHQWNTDFLYTKPELDEIKKVQKSAGLKLLDIHGSAGSEKRWFSTTEYMRKAGVELVKNRLEMLDALEAEGVLVMHAPNVKYFLPEVITPEDNDAKNNAARAEFEAVCRSLDELMPLLTSRLFAVGHDTQWLLKTPSDIRQDGNTAYLSFAEQRLLHQFAIDNTSALINSTTLQLGNDNRLTVTYSNLADFSGKLFPSVVKLDVASALLSAACTIVLQSVSFDTKVNVAPANTSKYNKVNLSTIIPM